MVDLASGRLYFDAKQVNCFLRPQHLVCDDIGTGYGLLFLFLTSLYHTLGIDRFFVDPDKHHFAFVASVLRRISGIEFLTIPLRRRSEIMPILREALSEPWPVIVPANVRRLPYTASYGKRDQAHYFIVTGFDETQQKFRIKDNLHLTPDNSGTEYGDATLTIETLAEITELYWDIPLSSHLSPAHPDERSWCLQIRPSSEFCQGEEASVLRLILSEFCRLVRPSNRERMAHGFFESRNLDRIRTAREAGDAERLKSMIVAYLEEANLALVHPRILAHASRKLENDFAGELTSGLKEYRSLSTTLRTNLLVKCLLPEGPSEEDWQNAKDRLLKAASALYLKFLSRLGEPNG